MAGEARTLRGDDYPSRLGGEGRLLPRLDPVVHASLARGSTGPLRPGEQVAFERDGFLAFEGLLPPQRVAELTDELDRLVEALRDQVLPDVIREPDSGEVRSIFAVHRRPGPFSRLARDPVLVRMAEQLLGSAVYVHQSRVNLKPGFEGREFYWHSDFETWHVEDGMPRMRAVSFSIHLTPNHEWNAPLLLIPGSHRHYVACAGRTPPEHHLQSLRRQEYGTPDRELLAWLVRTLNEQQDAGPLERLADWLAKAGRPEKALISIGATRYTDFGETNFLAPGDEAIVVLYDARRLSAERVRRVADGAEPPPAEGVSLLRQLVR